MTSRYPELKTLSAGLADNSVVNTKGSHWGIQLLHKCSKNEVLNRHVYCDQKKLFVEKNQSGKILWHFPFQQNFFKFFKCNLIIMKFQRPLFMTNFEIRLHRTLNIEQTLIRSTVMYKYISPSIWPLVTFLTSYPPPHPPTGRLGWVSASWMYCTVVLCRYACTRFFL